MPKYMINEKDYKRFGKRLHGKYVATVSFKNNKVVTFGEDPFKVYKRAKKRTRSPVMFYVHPPNMMCIYSALLKNGDNETFL